MKRTLWILAVLMLCFAIPAFAGIGDILGSVKGWLGGNAVALILTAALAIGGVGILVARFTPIVGSVGRLLIEIEIVFADKKVTREELTSLRDKINEIRAAIGKVKADG